MKLIVNRASRDEQFEEIKPNNPAREVGAAGLEALVGNSAPMRELKERLDRIIVAEHNLSDNDPPAVLITGETGTGKELVARALHYSGLRAPKPFVEINCASIPANLLEAELFGYERGAFTDAKERKPGLVEAAEGGTLFLDEIGEIDLTIQAKLLKLLEDKRIRRLGSIREQQVNVRIVAATNRDMESMVRAGSFRADLFYRLRILQIVVPPLRSRDNDILLLARQFVATQGARYGRAGLRLAPDAERGLKDHRWPGNVRELRNAVEQAVLLTRSAEITAAEFPFCQAIEDMPRNLAPSATEATDFDLHTTERGLIMKALTRTSWNVTRAAKLLGISRDTLRYRMEKFGFNAELSLT